MIKGILIGIMLIISSITLQSCNHSDEAQAALGQNIPLPQANRYADTAALFFALGGGWWNRKDVSQKLN